MADGVSAAARRGRRHGWLCSRWRWPKISASGRRSAPWWKSCRTSTIRSIAILRRCTPGSGCLGAGGLQGRSSMAERSSYVRALETKKGFRVRPKKRPHCNSYSYNALAAASCPLGRGQAVPKNDDGPRDPGIEEDHAVTLKRPPRTGSPEKQRRQGEPRP